MVTQRVLRERIAVSFLVAALVLAVVLGVMTAQSLTRPTSTLVASGDVSGGQLPGAAGSTTTSSTPGGTAARAAGGGGPAVAAGGKITIGGFFDITGPIDSSVERDTVRAYMQAVNASGGINGRQVEYVWCDSKYDASSAHSCAQQMIAQNVLAVVGLTAPLGENNEIRTLTAAGIPVIGGLGTPAEFSDPLSYPVSTSFFRYGTAIADEAKALGAKNPAVVVLGDVPWVHAVEANLLNRLVANGVGFVDVEEVSATQANYTATVFNMQHAAGHGASGGGPAPNKKCAATDRACPDYVIAALDPFSYHRLFDAMMAANWYPGVLGAGLDKFNVQQSYGRELAKAHSLVPFVSPYDNQGNATVRQYLGTVQRYYPGQFQALDIYTQHAWTAAMVFHEAAKRAGANLSRETLIQALNSIQGFQTGWSVPLSYGAGAHDPNHCFMYTSHESGKWQTTSGWVCS